MAKLTKQYAWWVDRRRLAVVEKNSKGEWQTISTSDLKLRIQVIKKGKAFESRLSAIPEIPAMFHEALGYKVIALGYKKPEQLNLELATYFENEFEKAIKRGKKHAFYNYQNDGQIRPVDF
jgi:hypothetical protein